MNVSLPFRLVLFSIVIVLSSCVSQKKYSELLNSKARSDRDNLRLKQVEEDCEQTNQKLSETLSALENTEGVVQDFKTDLATEKDAHATLQSQHDKFVIEHDAFVDDCAEDKNELTALLTVKQTELDDKNEILNALECTLYANEDELEERDQRIRELNAKILREQDRLDSLKSAISNAMLGLSADDLTVEQRDGKLYVSLSQNLLFEKNSKVLDPAGKNALAKLAVVLVASEDLDIMVEGHTDTDGDPEYNWNLSVSRATAVVFELTRSGLPGERVTAAGRAFFDPIDDSEGEAAKSKNRRTEIILTPNLDEILDFLKVDSSGGSEE